MSNLAQEIINLLSSRSYHELAAYDPPFDPMEVLGVSGRELSYSSALAWLLRDPVNRQFRQSFLSWVTTNLGIELDITEDEPVAVEREFGDENAGRIDIFANFPDRKIVVAIEVKVWADEGRDQISRYQVFLSREFADCSKLVVFLSPFGDPPRTAHESADAPALAMSWREIADMIGECGGLGEENDFRVQFRQHICRSVLMDNENERKIVLELLRQGDNARTIRKIIENYPNIGHTEYVDRWKTIVSEVASIPEDKLRVQRYPKYGSETKEVKITVPRWSEAGLPFTLMLYKNSNAAVCVLLERQEYQRNRDILSEFSKSTNGVVGDYPQAWGVWHSVLKSHGAQEEPPVTLIDAEIFEDCFWVQLHERLKEQLGPLMPQINRWLEKEQ